MYYALNFEPGIWLHASLPALIMAIILQKKLPRALGLSLLVITLALTGASYAKYRTSLKTTKMLETALPIRAMTGTIDAIEHVDKGLRITLSKLRIKNVESDKTPNRVRISFRAKTLPELEVGQTINVRAALLSPSGPVMPNAFDFSRYFFFRDIGAVGYAIPPITISGKEAKKGLREWLQTARDTLTASIQQTLPGTNGAIASGLITGDDSAIPEVVHEELRAANLLHIIAISGAHMVVIGGIVFVVLRSLLALIPGFGLRPAVKTLTAFLTLIAITAYVAITGFELSAVRAYVMLAIMLISILVKRDAQPMRSIALAALLMLAYDPSDVIEPGFQLSFAATLALIAAFDVLFKDPLLHDASMVQKAFRMFGFLCLTTLVAQAATTPIILFHFNNATLYGLVSNLVLTPVVTFILMPMVAIYFVLLPIGEEVLALYIMNYGIDAMLYVAHEVSTWPNAILYSRAPTEWGIALSTIGLLWLCLWQSRTRRYGVIAMIVGVASLFTVRSPDIFLSPRAMQIATRTGDEYVMLRGTSDGLFAKLWANAVGQKSFAEYRTVKPLKHITCKRDGCSIAVSSTTLRVSHTVADIKKGCPKVNTWISGYYFYPSERKACVQKTTFIDRADFDREGSHWGFFTQNGIEWHTTKDNQGQRPWSMGN